jgi:arylsulfatase A-like enzyme
MTPFAVRRSRFAAIIAAAFALAAHPSFAQPGADRPNVLLIVTDDHGYGDLGIHGNPKIQTPNLDRLGGQAVRFESFYVSPVCSPTRASLLTGRYNYRTGVVDTSTGRSLMHGDETTLAEMLSGAGYRTGIFGKWHLGDNYPLRAIDQGFDEALTLNGGGIGQPSDPPGGESYFDPMLRRNGEWIRTKGYVSDVLADATIDFIKGSRDRPFFAYLAFNAPHTPLEVPAEKYAKYKALNLKRDDFPATGHPIPAKFDPDTTAKIYGMVENIDDNVGRVLSALDDLKLADRTLVIFMTDNGPQQPRYNAGMLREKGTVNEGGIRVPFFVRLLGRFEGGRTVDRIAAHIDVTPTILEICGVGAPARVRFDGRSLVPLLEGKDLAWPHRTLFFQWHRGDAPERGRAFAARSQRYKLVQWQGAGANAKLPYPSPQLFDMEADRLEQRNLALEKPVIASELQAAYDAWFADVTAGRDYSDAGVARIYIGDPRENPVRLTRQDWRGPEAGWTPTSVGHWLVDVRSAGRYSVTLRFGALADPGMITFQLGGAKVQKELPAGSTSVEFADVALQRGEGTLSATVMQGARRVGVLDVVVSRR